ncbi:MAG: hypothetical protein JW718_11400 [Desulfovibrionaceae bacterium]|nr:hypothetical protein [Desulfovibrionaceae bacterium]
MDVGWLQAGEVAEVRREPNERLLLALLRFRFKDKFVQRLELTLNRGDSAMMPPDQLLSEP